MKQNKHENGSAGVFVVVAIALVLVAAGILYGARQFMMRQSGTPMLTGDLAKNENRHAMNDKPNSPAESGESRNSNSLDGGAKQENDPRKEESQPSAQGEKRDVDSDKDNRDMAPQNQPQEATRLEGRSTQSVNDSSADHRELPRTGQSSAAVVIAPATLAVTAVAYIRSRRAV